MIQLKKTFKKTGGRTFTQVYRTDKMAIYLVEWPEGNKAVEVFKITVSNSPFYDGPFEKYPSNEEFGKWAWSCSTQPSLEKIMKRHFPDIPIPKILEDTL